MFSSRLLHPKGICRFTRARCLQTNAFGSLYMTMIISKQIYVSGNVQGVFFRESTRQLAGELKLSGFVRNLRDGRVEVLAVGDDESIQSLIKWLKIGPKLAKVSTIKVLEMEISPDLLSQQKTGRFEIWPTT